jgi:hypothetical protein
MTTTPAPQIEQVRCRSAARTALDETRSALKVTFGILWQTSILTFAAVLITRFSEFGDFPAGGVLLLPTYLPALVLLGKATAGSAGYWLLHLSPAVGFLLFLPAKSLWNWNLSHHQSAGG